MSGQDLLAEGENAPSFKLEELMVRNGKSFDEAGAANACSVWISNRKTKFRANAKLRANRRLKTIEEEASDLRTSVLRLNHLSKEVRAGEQFLLGTLAGEMRATIYWENDVHPDHSYNPLLLRMASKANLGLPVYAVPRTPDPPVIGKSETRLNPDIPRVDAIFPTDQVCDLQESLSNFAMRIGVAPGKTAKAMSLIAELANTMGAAHYDESASDFIETMQTLSVGDSDMVTDFMCQTAQTVAALSDWVLSELKTKKLIE
jgi:hypothetical protein